MNCNLVVVVEQYKEIGKQSGFERNTGYFGGICFVNNERPLEETIKLADEKKIPLLATKQLMYECCGQLYKKGLSGTDDSE